MAKTLEIITQVKQDLRAQAITECAKLKLTLGQTNWVRFILGSVEFLEPKAFSDAMEPHIPMYNGDGWWVTKYGKFGIGHGQTFFVAVKNMKG